MYQVLILDDELTIRRGLRKIIDWEYYGFEVTMDAATVEEGLLLVAQYSPDLVILDMKIAKLTGIDFAQAVRAAGWNGKIIVVSGHNEFHFAQQCIQYNVVDYLLKPVSTEKLIHALLNAKKQLEEASYGDFLSDQSLPKLQSHILQGLLVGNFQYTESLKSIYHLDLTDGPFQLVCITPLTSQRKAIWEQTAQKFSSYFIAEGNSCFLILKGKKAQYYIHTLDFSPEETCLFSSKFQDIAQLPVYYQQCKKALSRLFFLKGNSNEIDLDNVTCEPIDPPDFNQLVKDIQQQIINGENENLRDNLQKIRQYFKQTDLPVSSVLLYCINFYKEVLHGLKYSNPQIDQYTISLDDFSKALSHTSLYDNIELIHREFSNLCAFYRTISSQNIVEKVKQYIDTYYWKSDLKLESLAQVFGYNSAYLGKLFTKETGSSFHNYVDTVRLEHAVILLKSNKKIYEIAEECGFSNAEYFTKKFKKQFQMLPTEYQKLEE